MFDAVSRQTCSKMWATTPTRPRAFGSYKQSGVGRENHKMMLDHYQQTRNMLASYSPKKLGFFGRTARAGILSARRETGHGGRNGDDAGVTATPAALALIAELRAEYGPLLFHQSGGCCDGSSPMCYPGGAFRIGESDILLGEIDGVPVYIGAAQGEAWAHIQLILDVVPGAGACSISTMAGKWGS